MSQYIPEICEQFIRTCKTTEVAWGYFTAGVILTLFIVYFVWFMRGFKKNVRK